MSSIEDIDRMQYRGFSVDYSIRINTVYNRLVGYEACSSVDKVLNDARTIFDFITEGLETAEIINIVEKKETK